MFLSNGCCFQCNALSGRNVSNGCVCSKVQSVKRLFLSNGCCFQCNTVSGENGANPELEKEARKCATKVAKETKLIREYYRQLTLLQSKSTDRVGGREREREREIERERDRERES